MSQIEIEIDGQTLHVEPNEMIIQAADRAGIYIPRFCYHKHLSVAANCRMCLVEVEKSPKALPACATPVMQGMKVQTRSAKALAAQRAVMEFLLINHPLDCPVCDQGGECELQDLSMGYGGSASYYHEAKRAVHDEDLGPLIATEMTRCILCTRCVRFGDEIAGLRELGVTQRGDRAEIATYVKHAMQSPVSGNIIDLCPVGALTAKPSLFKARAWELEQRESIAPHDCLGSHINVHTYNGTVVRVVARENDALNQTWLSDRDRFSYEGLHHADRLQHPRVRMNGSWQEVTWEKALEVAATGLRQVVDAYGGEVLGTLASPNATVEEFYLLQKIARALGAPHIDHRLRECDTSDQANAALFPGFECTLPELERADAIFLIGSHLSHEQPLAALRVHQAAKHGAPVLALNPIAYDFLFPVAEQLIVSPAQFVSALEKLHHALEQGGDHPFVAHLRQKQSPCFILGGGVQSHPEASHIRQLVFAIARKLNGRVNLMTAGSNAAGGWLAGMLPHRLAGGKTAGQVGLNAYKMLDEPRHAYVLLNVEPEDCANPSHFKQALNQARYVVALSTYAHPTIMAEADVILPVASFTESAGTRVNAEGKWQSFKGVARPVGEARPAWKVLRVLGNFLHIAGFDYETAEAVRDEVKEQCTMPLTRQDDQDRPVSKDQEREQRALTRIGDIPLYSVDGLVRRADSLQAAQELIVGLPAVRLNARTAQQYGLVSGDTVRVSQGEGQAKLPVVIDERVADDAVSVPGGLAETANLGDLFGSVIVQKF
jgi:NADH-quinone oxidoreductase subunit G